MSKLQHYAVIFTKGKIRKEEEEKRTAFSIPQPHYKSFNECQLTNKVTMKKTTEEKKQRTKAREDQKHYALLYQRTLTFATSFVGIVSQSNSVCHQPHAIFFAV